MGKKDNAKERYEDLSEFSENELTKIAEQFSKKFRVTDGSNFQLKNFDPTEDGGIKKDDKSSAKKILQLGVDLLADMQEKLYAQDKWSVLVIFQAMDAAGKDGAIKHVMSGINPQGCHVTSFKAPSSEELDHDFLWRCIKNLPERGRIGIFNRSYYEEVLVVRVHENILEKQKLAAKLKTENIWDERLRDIRNYENYLAANGTLICKIFLNVSKEEQKERFIERIDTPSKNWKFSEGDVKERQFWDKYMHAYEEAIKATATDKAPWYVIPADDKAFARIAVASAIIHTMNSVELRFPKLPADKIAALQTIKKQLLEEK
ncbi:MAG: polyphosphate kinase 2 family protein [Chitinophagales bacterium]|nr:polyphosphate kinase 2 family protein [Chitinophagales bacterium]